jgi:hypothetical protein
MDINAEIRRAEKDGRQALKLKREKNISNGKFLSPTDAARLEYLQEKNGREKAQIAIAESSTPAVNAPAPCLIAQMQQGFSVRGGKLATTADKTGKLNEPAAAFALMAREIGQRSSYYDSGSFGSPLQDRIGMGRPRILVSVTFHTFASLLGMRLCVCGHELPLRLLSPLRGNCWFCCPCGFSPACTRLVIGMNFGHVWAVACVASATHPFQVDVRPARPFWYRRHFLIAFRLRREIQGKMARWFRVSRCWWPPRGPSFFFIFLSCLAPSIPFFPKSARRPEVLKLS